jgi:hypothetical protein
MEVEMKMVKSLLLGTAAGLIAASGAQAADMPVKAKPVLYVKICSLYGDGFYYIPGTDTCLKLGGYVRVQAEYGAGSGGIAFGTAAVLPSAKYNRQETSDVNHLVRAILSLDVRTQTEYGTLRSYFRAGWDQRTPDRSGGGTGPCNINAPGNNCLAYWDRAFIQFAGFTVGRAQSFFDLYSYGGIHSYLNVRTTGDTGAAGTNLWAYTANFGNGITGTLSVEDPNAHNKAGTYDAARASWTINGGASNDNAFNQQGGVAFNNGWRFPDVIANLRVDQAWGFAGVSVALHDASGAYWLEGNNVNNGHPVDKLGWAVAVGGMLNLPGGDQAGANFVYAKGASGYAMGPAINHQIYDASTSVGVGWTSDGIFESGLDIELTEAWSINAAYQHIWANPKWRTSVYGGYAAIRYNDAAKRIILSHLPGAAGSTPCGVPVGGAVWPPIGITAGTGNSCDPDWSFYQIGSRTQWNPVPQLDIGIDVFYTHLNTAFKGPAVGGYGPNAPRPTVFLLDDQNVWSAIFRWQRNFYP